MQGEGSAALTGTAGMCMGTNWSPTPMGRGGGRGEGPRQLSSLPCSEGSGREGQEEGMRDSGWIP